MGEVLQDGATEATADAALAEKDAQLQADFEAWWAERKAKGLSLQRNSRRIWAAMEGWGAVKTQEDWERLQLEAAEDWASGRTLIEMLGGSATSIHRGWRCCCNCGATSW